jgi:hypothetical protein
MSTTNDTTTNGKSSKQPATLVNGTIVPEPNGVEHYLAELHRVEAAEDIGLQKRGGDPSLDIEEEANLADVIAVALGRFTDETVERQALRAISNELLVLHNGLLGGHINLKVEGGRVISGAELLDYIDQLAHRALAACELGRRFERAAKAVQS